MPSTNQTVPFESDMNITYDCFVTDDRTAVWVFGDVQVRPGSMVADSLVNRGLIIEAGSGINVTRITVTRLAREDTFENADVELRCAALMESDVNIQFGEFLYVRTFCKC